MPYLGRVPSAVPVTADDIPANSIDASKIVDGSIELAEIADNSITDAKLNSSKLDGIEAGATADQSKADIDALAVNAGTLDGFDSSQFLRSDVEDATTQRTIFKACETNNWDTIATSAGSQGAFEVLNTGAGNDAFMTFHASEDYAGYFGLDADTNDLAWGGWSVGAVKHKIWHDGNTAGTVLQVVQGLNGNESAFTGTSGACGASVTITPKSASSKILVMVNIDGITVTSGDSGYGKFYVTRNSANISFFGYPRNWSSADNSSGTTMATTYLDSPSSTSALTYGTNWANLSGSVTIQINRDGAPYSKSTITVMEIAQ